MQTSLHKCKPDNVHSLIYIYTSNVMESLHRILQAFTFTTLYANLSDDKMIFF